MIAIPLNSSSLLDKLFLEEISVKDVFLKYPNEINGFFTNEPWFFFEESVLTKLQKENENVQINDSAKRWNSIKLDIYYTFSEPEVGQRVALTPIKADWEYFIHFNKNQSKKSKLWTRSYPTSCNSDTYWIDEHSKKLFGELTIIDAFKRDPLAVERLIIFDKDLFFDEENIAEMLATNNQYKFSNKAILWNEEKYSFWLERRKEEIENSRLDWEGRIESEKLQQSRSEGSFIDSDQENYFNAITDGHLGSFKEFFGDNDDAEDIMGR